MHGRSIVYMGQSQKKEKVTYSSMVKIDLEWLIPLVLTFLIPGGISEPRFTNILHINKENI